MRKVLALGIAAAVVMAPTVAAAEVTAFEVLRRAPAFGGRSFDGIGTYEMITAKATIAIDPAEKRNGVIVDLGAAPKNAQGLVEGVADVVILRPADASKGNGTLLVDVPNRGTRLAPQLFDDSPQPGANRGTEPADAGIGFLERRGYTIAWIGWQGEIPSKPDQLAMTVPVIGGITGPAREEFIFDNATNPVRATLAYPATQPADLKITVRAAWPDQRQAPAGLSARLIDPKTVEIARPTGFDAGALYEITYTARDPMPLGLGFAAVRDVTSFLRRAGSSGNPLADPRSGASAVKRTIGFGVSQDGRFLRDFLYLGFNQDMSGRRVFDGLMPHVGGTRRLGTNIRFGQTGRNARHPQDPAWIADLFPFTYDTLTDPFTGRRDGLLRRCRTTNTCPKVIQTDSEHEWWASHASLLVTDLEGNAIDLPDEVRAYMIAGTPHFAEATDVVKKGVPAMSLPQNPLHSGAPMRALLTALDRWITDGTEPPPSQVPNLDAGTLVTAESAVRRDIPGLPYRAQFSVAAVSDQSVLPPREIGRYPVFVPKADADGNAIGGVHLLAQIVPRATYTGWNPRAEGFGATQLYPLQGAVVAFAKTEAERKATNDPRRSLVERYPTGAAYIAAVEREAKKLVQRRLLLEEDATRAIEAARKGTLDRLGTR